MKQPPKMDKKVYIRALERRDLPKVVNWLMLSDFYQNHLSDYPVKDKKLLKNQLLKEIALNKFITAKTQLLVAEVTGNLLVGLAILKKIDWRSRHLDLVVYIPREFRQTDISREVTNEVYKYIFMQMDMHKIYTYLIDLQQDKISLHKKHGNDPEAVLEKYIYNGKDYNDLYIYAVYKSEILKLISKT